MFTGIIETIGTVREVRDEGTNRNFAIASAISNELRVDQSVSHNGVCLTVTRVDSGVHWVIAVHETLSKSSFGKLKVGALVNIERSMVANGRFDGHIVQGHVDQTAAVTERRDENGSHIFSFDYDRSLGNITVEKGSICVDGVSLTCFNATPGKFSVAIIPYTFAHTTFSKLQVGDTVNLEFDIVGKYIKALLAGS